MSSKQKTTATNEDPKSPEFQFLQPVVVDLGKRSRKKIKQMKKGEGALLEEVRETVQEVAQQIDSGEGTPYQPVIIIYERIVPRSRGGLLPFLARP